MGISKKHVPGCSCCGCVYEASDGNEYSDDFTTLDVGWQVSNAALTFDVTGGRGRLRNPLGFTGDSNAYRQLTVSSMTDLLIIIEADFISAEGSIISGIFFGAPTAGIYPFVLHQLGTTGTYGARAFGSSYAIDYNHQTGDKLTIKFMDAGGGEVQVCYFINEELVLDVQDTDTFGTENYGLMMIDSGAGENALWDDFTIHFGNP